MKIEKYFHHGAMVSVQSDLKGQHWDHCLCYQGCTRFRPGAADNCEVVEANLANCKQFGTVQPIWECPTFEAARPAPRLIGLCGPAGGGKSTVASFLEAQGFVRLRFAGPLKAMLHILLMEAGVPPIDVPRYIDGDLKETPCEYRAGKTPRQAMQTLGTEWGRRCIGNDYWMQLTLAKAERLLAEGNRVVIDDVRFANEAAAVVGARLDNIAAGREVWRIDGRGGISGDHVSEGQVFPADVRLDNSGDLGDLEAHVLTALIVAPSGKVKT